MKTGNALLQLELPSLPRRLRSDGGSPRHAHYTRKALPPSPLETVIPSRAPFLRPLQAMAVLMPSPNHTDNPCR